MLDKILGRAQCHIRGTYEARSTGDDRLRSWIFAGDRWFFPRYFSESQLESAQIVPGGYLTVDAAAALPGWTCYLDTNQTGSVWYNALTLDSAMVALHSFTSSYAPVGFIGGQYCVSFQPGAIVRPPSLFYFARVSIAQTGEIRADAQSLRFRATWPFPVTFAGNAVPLVLLDSQPGYNLYGGDISQFAGQTGELRITSSGRHYPADFLDRLQFSIEPIPEPTTFCLLVIGFGLFLTARVIPGTTLPRFLLRSRSVSFATDVPSRSHSPLAARH